MRATVILSIVYLPVFAAWAGDGDGAAQVILADPSMAVMMATLPETAILSRLEAGNARIGRIVVYNDNIFDLDDPREGKWLYRAANKLHIRTRPDVIVSQLLFREGDLFSKQQLEESERLLRENRYIRDAEITPVSVDGETVDLAVWTKDVWTLNPSVSFGRSGGSNSGGLGLKESNLFGTGTYVGMSYKSNVDRASTALQLGDNNFMRSRYQLWGRYANNSDGYSRDLSLVSPFYALDTRRSGGFVYQDDSRIDSLYDQGTIVADFQHASRNFEASYGWSAGLKDGRVRRYTTGLAYDAHTFTENPGSTFVASPMPDDRRYLYPFAGVEWVEDKYEKSSNFDQINVPEDRYIGRRFAARIGYSGNSEWHFKGSFNEALFMTDVQSLLIDGEFDGRVEAGVARNAMLTLNARFYRRRSNKNLFFAKLSTSLGRNLDIDNPLALGGDTGLRGYPLRYQSGDKKVLLTIEQRLFTNWYPFRLFNVGGAVFFDAGRTWGPSPVVTQNRGLLRDVGFGLRIASSRSGSGRVMHIDLAFPLDGGSDISQMQLLIEAKSSF
jgi:hemolysin activation/secretion protein